MNKKTATTFKMKNVLITGSTKGIGLSTAIILKKQGYNVFTTGRNKEVLAQNSTKYNFAGYFAGDLLEKGASEILFKEAEQALGKIDILINNAGAYSWSPLEKTEARFIEDIFMLNLSVPYNLCKLAVPKMKSQKWGRIINIGSISGAVGEANASLYSASKAGLIGMTKSLALELAEYGITINVINPGWLKTDLTEDVLCTDCSTEKDTLDMIPQKRWIEPSEIAELIKYLLSTPASGITGQSINLCCGLSLG